MAFDDYFIHSKDYFWEWENNGEVVAIPNGSTIAYKELIIKSLEALSYQGLPRFGSLLLVLSALNPDPNNSISHIKSIFEKYGDGKINKNVEATFQFLENLKSLPEKYKTGKYKNLLLRAIFESSHNSISIKKSDYLKFSLEYSQDKEFGTFRENTHYTFQEDIKVVSILQRKYPTKEDIINQLLNLPDLEEEITLEPNQSSEESTDLIQDLIDNPITNEIGSLVRILWSGLQLPFRNTAPSQRPMGGVSDLANKGNLDQLLISEFANDDVIFLSRLANNEALYLNRETPPESNNFNRVILIDVSLKNWGTPKTLSFATMLAIAKHPKTDIHCEIFTVGKTYQSVEHNSVEGLVKAVQAVSPVLDCSEGLRQYFKDFPISNNTEVLILTEKSTQYYSPIVTISNEFKEFINFWIYNDVEGNIEIFKKLKNSKKHVQTIQLPFERLWDEHRPKLKIKPRKSADYYPILINTYGKQNFVQTGNNQVFQLTKDKKLIRMFDFETEEYYPGMEIVHENLIIHEKDFSMGVTKNGDYYILIFKRQYNRATILNIRTKKEISVDFYDWNYLGDFSFVFHNDKFYHPMHVNYNMPKKSQYIDLEGNVGSEEIDLTHQFETEEKQRSEAIGNFDAYPSVLKKVRRVFVNSDLTIGFNQHRFLLSSNAQFLLTMSWNGRMRKENKNIKLKEVIAIESHKNHFVFPDGSSIRNKIGFFILKSSDKSIPPIFVPGFIDLNLGVSTYEHFAGNDLHLNKALYEIALINSGNNRLACVKIIKEITGFGLGDSKDIMEGWPSNLLCYFSENEAKEALNRLANIGAKASILKTNPSFKTPEIIDTSQFLEKYITPFINTILQHGT